MLILLFIFVVPLDISNVNALNPEGVIPHHNESFATKLYKEVKILCLITTWPENHKTKAKAVKETWAKRCNKYLFISSKTDSKLNTIALPLEEGRQHLWLKIKAAFMYIYKKYFNDYDWFVKADDDTYMIVENLRYMLYQYDPLSPLYLGCKFKRYVSQGYMSGGAGYILSKEALRRFVEIGLPDRKYCKQEDDEVEDVEMGRCLEKLNVTAVDTLDENMRERMLPLDPEYHLNNKSESWYSYYKFSKSKMDCCSSKTISFHYISPENMYVMDFLIYKLKPFGLESDRYELPKKIHNSEKKL
ncbi:C1GALT1.2 family protein [Megaselia abdita]